MVASAVRALRKMRKGKGKLMSMIGKYNKRGSHGTGISKRRK
jgi:hypothetical protein